MFVYLFRLKMKDVFIAALFAIIDLNYGEKWYSKAATIASAISDYFFMPETHLSVLRAGLAKRRELTNTRKNELLAQLQNQEKISSVDEEWLDNEGKLVDEEAAVSLLERRSHGRFHTSEVHHWHKQPICAQFRRDACKLWKADSFGVFS